MKCIILLALSRTALKPKGSGPKMTPALWNQICLNTSTHLVAWGEKACSLSAATCKQFRCGSHAKTGAHGCQQCCPGMGQLHDVASGCRRRRTSRRWGDPTSAGNITPSSVLCAFPNYVRIDEFPLCCYHLHLLSYPWSFPRSTDLRVCSTCHMAFDPVKILNAYRKRTATLMASP